MFSFKARRKKQDISLFMRRIIDLTSPNRPRADDSRHDMRYNRSIPVICCPWRKNKPDTTQLTVGITKDLTDSGMGIITTCDLQAEEIVVMVELPQSDTNEPWIFRGEVRQITDMPGGCSLYGVELMELLNSNVKVLETMIGIKKEFQSVPCESCLD